MKLDRRQVVTALIGAIAAIGTGIRFARAQAATGPRVGATAPGFKATDSNGRTVSLADYSGKTVVLEWTNDECPFVRKHYGSHNMQALQQKWTGKDVVWLSVISSASGEQGFVEGPKANELTVSRGAAPTAVLLDPTGDLGRVYKAQTTPHMYIVEPDGTLAYMGGIDDKPSTRPEDIKTSKNFVEAALTELAEGKPVTVATARPYGCTVKYGA